MTRLRTTTRLAAPKILFLAAFFHFFVISAADPERPAALLAESFSEPLANTLPRQAEEPSSPNIVRGEAGGQDGGAPYAAAQNGAAPSSVYAPFSGAIYIVNPGGGRTFDSASPAICPNNAPQSCGNLNVWNWCCPSGHTCAWLSDSVVGCCPPGCSCSNTNRINTAAAVVTQTLAAVQQPTVTYIGQTTVIVGAGGAHWGGPPSGPPNGPPNGPPPGAHFDGYCSTLYANGPNLPTTAAGPCGTILVLNTGVMVRPWVEGRRALAFFLALALGGLGWLA